MKCIICDMVVPNGNKFCPNCGNKVEEMFSNFNNSNFESLNSQVNGEINNYDNGTNNLNDGTNSVKDSVASINNTNNVH